MIMRRNRKWSCLWLLLWGVWSAVWAQPAFVRQQVKDEAACRRWVDEQLSGMTLKQRIGQLVIHTVAPVATQKNKDNIRKAVEEYGVGGLLFSGGQADRQVQLTNWAQQLSKVPLMVAFDGEWGLAMRLKTTPAFPKNRVLGCVRNDTLLYQYGREVARQLREVGACINFAPVADVDNNPLNPVINVRSFGSDPHRVARQVSAYARGLQAGGVLAVCKHFPGHGDTETDSHKALPSLNFDRARLDSVELCPFREAIRAGIGGVMVGHLHVPSLGRHPASVSADIVQRTLRQEFGFEGLVFTDALEMKGIAATEYVSAEALVAGNDVVLARRNLKQELDGVLKAVREGRISEEDIAQKCRKVLTYKYALGLHRWQPVKTEGLLSRLDTKECRSLQARLREAAVTVVKDSADALPLDLSLSGTVLLSLSGSMAEAAPFYQALHEVVPVTWLRGDAYTLEQLGAKLRPAQQVIVALHQKECAAYAPLLKRLAADKPVALVCFRNRKVLEQLSSVLPAASAVVLAHSGETHVQQYVAQVLVGKQVADGRLSVGFAGFKAGTGVTLDPERPRSFRPEELGMSSSRLARIDSIALEGIAHKAYPGCHIVILRKGCPVYDKCFGTFDYNPRHPVKGNSLYDLASVSKVAGTLLAVMKLYDEGRFGLTDPVSRYLPFLKGTDKERITVEDLLYHQSGLPAYHPFYKEAIDLATCRGGLFRKRPDSHHKIKVGSNAYACTDFSYKAEWVSSRPAGTHTLRLTDSLYLNPSFRQEILRQLVEVPLRSRTYRYSCLNFMLLKEMVETLTAVPMDVYLDSVFYRPMGLRRIAYVPLARFPKEEIVPTAARDFLRGKICGYVHDEAAAFMGGVSGNAGLFASAKDVATVLRMLLDKGVCGDRRYLSRATCELFIGTKAKATRRGLGFDKPDVHSATASPCAEGVPASVFGHTGFTGTCVWADPENDLVFVFLSNRVYPQAYGSNGLSRLKIRPRIQKAMYESIIEGNSPR